MKDSVHYTLSTMAVEGIVPSMEAIALCQQMSEGTISADQAIEVIKQKYGLANVDDR